MRAPFHSYDARQAAPSGRLLSMKGNIRCKRRCHCGAAFTWNEARRDLLCVGGHHATQAIYIDLSWGKPAERLKLYSNKRGQTFASGEEARRTLDAIRLDIDNDTFNPTDYQHKELAELRWDAVVDAHLARLPLRRDKEGRPLSKNTILQAKWARRFLVQAPLKGRDIRQIRAGHMEDWRLGLEKATAARTGEPLSDNAKASIVRRLHAVFNEAWRREDIPRVPPLPPVQVAHLDYTIPTEAQRQAILAHIPEKHRLIYRFLFLHPLRPQEACKIRLGDVDWQARHIHIPKRGRKAGPGYDMPIHSGLFEELRAAPRDSLLLFSYWGRARTRSYVPGRLGVMWRQARALAGLPQFELYSSTRHYIATAAVRSGVSIDAVSHALGHTNLHATRIYAHRDAESIRSVIELPRKEDQGAPDCL